MPFDYDVANPTDDFLIPNAPLNHRDSRAAIKGSVDVEHESTTGRHKFGRGLLAARDAITDWEIGSLWFRTETTPGYLEICTDDTAGPPRLWEEVDVLPKDGGGLETLPRVNARSSFTACQFAPFDVITTGAGAPRTCAIDLLLSPSKFVEIIDATRIENPVNPLALASTTVMLELLMDAGGGHAITFGDKYITPDGVTPVVLTTPNARNVLFITQMRTAITIEYLVSASPGLAGPI